MNTPVEFDLPRQLPSESYPLSDQQAAIVQAVVGERKDVKVRAKAGCGKTSTLEAIARRFAVTHPDLRILYVAFNASVRAEAEKRMPSNVESRTGHALAWQWAGPAFTAKIRRPSGHVSEEIKFLSSRPATVAKHLGITRTYGEDFHPSKHARAVIAVVDRFASSADTEIGHHHLEQADGFDVSNGLSKSARDIVLANARRYWADLCTPLNPSASYSERCKFKASFDHIRKMWALANPDLTQEGSGARQGADVIFLDEAQDTPPVVARVVAAQQAQRVIVGDAEQAIYGFTGAQDYLDEADIETSLPLTTSYRFGPQIEDIANRYLRFLGSEDLVVGGGDSGRIGPVSQPDAILTRTNLGMLAEIVRERDHGRTVAVLESTKADLSSLAASALWLQGELAVAEERRSKNPYVQPDELHPSMSNFTNWQQFVNAAERSGDITLKTSFNILKQIGAESLAETMHGLIGVREASDAIRNRAVDVTAVTAHKAKGLEWDSVRIGADFAKPKWSPIGWEFPASEELRLAYVAVTRARRNLDPGSLAWIFKHTDLDGRLVTRSAA